VLDVNYFDELRIATVCKDQDINGGTCANLPQQLDQTGLGGRPGQQQNVGISRLDRAQYLGASLAHTEQLDPSILSCKGPGKIARQNPAYHDADGFRDGAGRPIRPMCRTTHRSSLVVPDQMRLTL